MNTHCRHGHEYTPENSYVHNGVTQCKECRRVNRNNHYRRYNSPVPPEIRWPKHSHCVKGHKFTDKTRIPLPKGGSRCRVCQNERQKTYAQEHSEHMYKSRSESQMRKRYGPEYDLEARNALLKEQGNACAICGRTGLIWGKGYNDVWHTDHDHNQPGTHRGILCATCNLALGKLEPHWDKVLAYLDKWRQRNLPDANLNCDNTRYD